jgi:predicted aspartyl protease
MFIDTGATRITISPNVQARLGLTTRAVEAIGIDAVRITTRLAPIESIEIPGIQESRMTGCLPSLCECLSMKALSESIT